MSSTARWRDLLGPRGDVAHRRRAEDRAGARSAQLREEFWQDVRVPGEPNNLNPSLDYAGRVADYMEFAELLALDALQRKESCGGHFREEYQTPDNEALRNDDEIRYVAAWEFSGVGSTPVLHKEAAGIQGGPPVAAKLQVEPDRGIGFDIVMTLMTLLRVWRQPGRISRGGWSTTCARDVSPGHVVPRDARRRERGSHPEGRGPDRVRFRLPRGHLRVLRARDQRHRPRPGRRRDDVPAPHAPVQGRRHDRRRAVARAGVPGAQGSDRRPRAPSTASSPPAATSRSTPVARRMATASRSQSRSPNGRWTRRRASAAAPASRRARTPRRTCSPRAKIAHLALLPQGEPERGSPRRQDGGADGRRGLRRLLE